MEYELLDNEPESLGKQAAKGLLRTGARTFETVAGLPGNILSTGLGALNYVGKAIGDQQPIPTYEELQQKLPVSLPTTEQLRSATQRLTGPELEPTTEWGKKYDSAVETITSLMTPLGPLGKGAKFTTALKGSLGGEIAQTIAQGLGGSDLTQAIAKTAGVMGGVLGFRKGELKKVYEKNYDEFGKLAKGKKIPAAPLREKIESIYDKYTKGDSPAKNFARERLLAIESAIEGDKIDAGRLWELKKDANLHFSDASKAERQVLHDIISVEKDTLKAIGPNYKMLEQADDIYSSFLESDRATKFIKKHMPSGVALSPLVKGLLGVGTYATGKLPAVAAGAGIYKGVSEGNRLRKFLGTSTGKEFYINILKDAFAGNATNLTKDIAKLNGVAKEFELLDDKEYELID